MQQDLRNNSEIRSIMAGSKKRKQYDGVQVARREKINTVALEQVAQCHAAGA